MNESQEINRKLPPLNKVRQHSRSQWLEKFAKSPKCHYCGVFLNIFIATKDHLIPTCRGGSDEIENIVAACKPCNQAKAWRTEAEFIELMPELCKDVRRLGGRVKPKPSYSLEETANEPGLLKKITAEREKTSWAWRNPYF